MEKRSNSTVIKVLGLLFVVVIAGIISWQVIEGMNYGQADELENQSRRMPMEMNPQVGHGMQHRYRNGQFTATGKYQSPAQREEIEVTLTVNDGVVTDAVFVGKATHPTSKLMQGKFSEGFSQAVIGKNIDELNLTVVNGSSLTPKGFMDALSKIKAQSQT